MYQSKLFILLTSGVLLGLGMLTLAQPATPDPTEQSATIEAAIENLLTATAQEAGVGATQTQQAQQAAATETARQMATSNAQTQAAVTPNVTATIEAGLKGTVAAFTQEANLLDRTDALRSDATPLQYIPGGTFRMGTTVSEIAEAVRQCVEVYNANCQLAYGEDSIPAHEVTLDAYLLELREVSYLQFVSFLNALGPGSHLDSCNGQRCATIQAEDETSPINFNGERYTVAPFLTEYPASNVTWHGAGAYCDTLSRRLPTEAEWEFAARGTDGRLYPWGNEFAEALARTRADAEVGSRPVNSYFNGASPFGVLNMAGNVAEWTSDWYDADYYSVADEENPTGPEEGTERVLRGGSWDAMPFFARSVHRQYLQPGFAAGWVGFRCAADAAGSVPPRNLTPTPTRTATPGS